MVWFVVNWDDALETIDQVRDRARWMVLSDASRDDALETIRQGPTVRRSDGRPGQASVLNQAAKRRS